MVDVHQGPVIPYLGQHPVGILFFNENDIAVVFRRVGVPRPGVGIDEDLDKVLEDGEGGIVGG
jgi:hypothetical protein